MDSLQIAIYPYIPDLAGDQYKSLTGFIKNEFSSQYGVDIEVTCDYKKMDPYNVDGMDKTYLSPDGYDVLEVDTLLLGDIVKTEKVLPLDTIFAVNNDIYAPTAVESVKLDGKLYAVPTLQCANFLTELSGKKPPQKPILQDWTSYSDMKTVMDPAYASGVRLVGDFTGSFGLPMFYLGAYIDKNGPKTVYDGIASQPAKDPALIENMKHFTGYGACSGGKNPTTDGTYHSDPDLMINDIADSEHVFMYGYSENLGKVRKASALKDKRKTALTTVSAPLDKANYLLTYTDAVVVNKSKYQSSTKRAEDIQKFVNFYSDLKLRTQYALGEDLPKDISGLPMEDTRPRYVLPALKQFYTQEVVTKDPYYPMFHKALERSVAAPNHGFYDQKNELNKELKEALGM